MSKRESTVAIVSIDNFRQRLQSKLRQPIPVALHQSTVVHSLTKNTTWSSDFLQWLDDVKTEYKGKERTGSRHDVVDDAGASRTSRFRNRASKH